MLFPGDVFLILLIGVGEGDGGEQCLFIGLELTNACCKAKELGRGGTVTVFQQYDGEKIQNQF